MGIDNDYVAYCFDEVALFIESEATDKEGKINFNRLRWKSDNRNKNNKELINFINKHSKNMV